FRVLSGNCLRSVRELLGFIVPPAASYPSAVGARDPSKKMQRRYRPKSIQQPMKKIINSCRTLAWPVEYRVVFVLGVAALTTTLQAQIILDPAWRVTPDTNSPGFKWAYFQAGVGTSMAPNTIGRAESDLAGQSIYTNLGDPNVIGGGVAVAIAPS